MSAIEKALVRSRSIYSSAYHEAVRIKQTKGVGGLVDVTPSSGLAQLSQWKDQSLNRERYSLFRGWVYSAINALAMEGAGQPVVLGKIENEIEGDVEKTLNRLKSWRIEKMPDSIRSKAAEMEMEIVVSHPFKDSLECPNPIQNRWQFVYSFFSNLLLTGWAFVVGSETEEGGYEFYALPTTWVQPNHDDGPFSKFRINNPKKPETADSGWIGRENVAFAYLPNPSNPMAALAPAYSQQSAIKIDDYIQSSQVEFFRNGIFPSVVVRVGKQPHPDVPAGIRPRLTPTQRRQVVGAIKKTMGGVANYGEPAIVDGLIEGIERLSATQNEMGWERSEKTIKSRILSAFSVHPFILGEQMAGSYAQAFNVENRFCKRVNSILDMLSNVMSSFVKNIVSDEFLVWWEKCAPFDPSIEKSKWEGARTRGDVTQNEFRAWMGLPPDEDKNEAVLDRNALQSVVMLAGQVSAGNISSEQGVAILEALGLPTENAAKIIGMKIRRNGEEEEDMDQDELEGSIDALEEAVAALRVSPREIVDYIWNNTRAVLKN